MKKKLSSHFSPWQIKQTSFQIGQDEILYDSITNLKNAPFNVYKKEPINHNSSQQSKNSFPSLQTQIKKSNSFKTHYNQKNPKIASLQSLVPKQQQTQKWKQLAIASSSRNKILRQQYTMRSIKKERNWMSGTSQPKSRRSSCCPSQDHNHQSNKQPHFFTTIKQQKQRPILQQLAIKNFIIQGHYSQKQPAINNNYFNTISTTNNKKRQNKYVMKQKFAELKVKKSISSAFNPHTNEYSGKQNLQTILPTSYHSSAKKVIMKGNKQKQNLFNVIKLQRQINKKLQTIATSTNKQSFYTSSLIKSNTNNLITRVF